MAERGGGSPAAMRDAYARAAPSYDRRWRDYLDATLPPTRDATPLVRGARVLDVGCGTGLLLEMLLRRERSIDAWGVDITPEMLAAAAARLGGQAGLVLGDAADLPFEGDAFDIVVTASTLHHWAAPDRTLREIARVLRPGGALVLTDWCADHLPTRLLDLALRWRDPSHHRAYTVAAARGMLEGAGIDVAESRRFRLGWRWGFMTLTGHAGHDAAASGP